MPRPLGFSMLSGWSGSGTDVVIEAGARVPDGDHDLAGLVAGDGALELLGRVTAAAVPDRVGDRFLQRELHCHDVLLAPALFLSTWVTPSVTFGIAHGSAGIVIVNWQVEQNGIMPLSLRTFSWAARSSSKSASVRPRRVPFGERPFQFEQVAPQLELRLDLAAQRVERLDLLSGQRCAATRSTTQSVPSA